MKQASIPVYIRFGEIPKDGKSKIHLGDEIVGEEVGVSVYEAIYSDGYYYPKLPDNPNDNTIIDYFEYLMYSDKKVYLVIGDRMRLNGKDNEPLLENVKVIKEITNYYNRREQSWNN